jgi:hypothetical protein
MGQLSSVSSPPANDNTLSLSILYRLAEDYKLQLVYKKDFHEVFMEHRENPEFGPLLVKMKVVDANGESAMDEAQWEAASTSVVLVFLGLKPICVLDIYVAFAFQKMQ